MDDVSVFKSSRTSTWPIQLLMNKYSVANIDWLWRKLVLAGAWFGKENPIWGIFQAPLAKVMNSLPDNKVLLFHKGK